MVYFTQADWFAIKCKNKFEDCNFDRTKLYIFFGGINDKEYEQLKWLYYNQPEKLKAILTKTI